jgi:hypothetical protein
MRSPYVHEVSARRGWVKRALFVVAMAAMSACGSSGSSGKASPSTTAAPTTTTVPVQPFQGTGVSLLFHEGPGGFVLTNGTIVSVQLGHGKFVEHGTFTGLMRWTANGTMTAANRDTVKFRSVGGVISSTPTVAHSATSETITGGTGKYAGATGTFKTTGDTVVAASGLQTYTFTFKGTIKTTA